MLFNSYTFIFVFLPFTFIIYFYLLHRKLIIAAKAFLVFSSLFFYSYWSILYLPLIISSMLFNYFIGSSLNGKYKLKTEKRKSILIFGILSNLSLLGYFKYADFFIENINTALGSQLSLLNLALPLAISFFTFQQIAYLVDNYSKETVEYNFLNYALFVTFFPQLIAGPIVHHKEMMPQFSSKWNLVKKYKNIAMGLFVFSIGLFKKVIIADNFAVWVNHGFDTATSLNIVEAWASSLSYTFQLYFDFSGYTDMAIGIALLFNIKLPVNFNSPYKAKNIQEFWRRWHITLSRFLKNYIYIPLGGNQLGNFKAYSNLMITFILGGLWHGAGWTFIFWGLLHGSALVIHRVWKNIGFQLHYVIAWFITFNFINISWVFFRAQEWNDAIKVLSAMFGLSNVALNPIHKIKELFPSLGMSSYTLPLLIIGFIIVLFFKNSSHYLHNFQPKKLETFVIILMFIIAVLHLSQVSEFLYFNF